MITLHHCHEARSMRTLWLLNEMALDFELKIYPFGKELRTPEYLAVHPLGRVPCFQDDDLILFETGAITEYLVEKYPEKGFACPPGNAERPQWLQWLHYAETVAVHGATLTQQHIVIYEDKDRSPLLMKLERRRLEKALEVLDATLPTGANTCLKAGFPLLIPIWDIRCISHGTSHRFPPCRTLLPITSGCRTARPSKKACRKNPRFITRTFTICRLPHLTERSFPDERKSHYIRSWPARRLAE